MITRKQYMDQSPRYEAGQGPSDIFRAYYGQFVTDAIKRLVIERIGIGRLRASSDPHMNDIPLPEWDRLAGGSGSPNSRLICNPSWAPLRAMKDAGDYYTLAGGVCILKEAARLAMEDHANGQ